MASSHGLTVDEALARIMEAECIRSKEERRKEYRRILDRVHSMGYHEGVEDTVYGH